MNPVLAFIIIVLLALILAAAIAFAASKYFKEPTCSCTKFKGEDLRCPKHGVYRKGTA